MLYKVEAAVAEERRLVQFPIFCELDDYVLSNVNPISIFMGRQEFVILSGWAGLSNGQAPIIV